MAVDSVRFMAEIVLGALLFLPLLLVTIDTFFRILFLVIAIDFSPREETKNLDTGTQELTLLILVVANNEENIIGRTLQMLFEAIGVSKSVTLALLADNCTDQTAQIAETLGVKAYIREDGDPGKGKALSWLTYHVVEDTQNYDLIAILDADTVISADFCQNIRAAFYSDDTYVVQSFVQPVDEIGLPIATLVAFSEILSQKIDDAARSRLGWTSPLRGTGMVFRRNLFFTVCRGLKTQVDDIEISLRLAEMNVRVVHNPHLKIFDSKSANIFGLARQRGRWLKGQRDIWQGWREKLKILYYISNWALLHALLLKPKIALFIIKIALLCIIQFLSVNIGLNFLGMLVSFSLCIDIIYYLTGLRYVSEPVKYLRLFFTTPVFLLMWILGWFFSLSKKDEWLRARD